MSTPRRKEGSECTCHCGGSMFYRHLHAPSCPLSVIGEEAPESEVTRLRAEVERLTKERDDLQTLNKDVTKHRDALAQHHDELGAILIAAGVQPQTIQCTIIHPTVDLLHQQLAASQARITELEQALGEGTANGRENR